MTFAQKLDGLMKNLALTQTQVGKLTGICNSSISQYRSGKCEPSQQKKRDIARALGVQETYFEEVLPEVKPQKSGPFNLSVENAAKLMGKSAEWVYKGLQDGVFPFGYAVNISGRVWSYFISSVKFTEYTGIEIPDEMRR